MKRTINLARRSAPVFVVGLALILSACSSSPVRTDFDRSVDFSTFSTFAFISDSPLMLEQGTPSVSPLLEGRLKSATEELLTSKGFSKYGNPEAADFTVAFTVGSREQLKVTSYPEPYRPAFGAWRWGGAYYMGAGTDVDVRQYTEGTLAIDIYDVDGHKPAWHGVATSKITDEMRENPEAAVNAAVAEILSQFPPGSTSK